MIPVYAQSPVIICHRLSKTLQHFGEHILRPYPHIRIPYPRDDFLLCERLRGPFAFQHKRPVPLQQSLIPTPVAEGKGSSPGEGELSVPGPPERRRYHLGKDKLIRSAVYVKILSASFPVTGCKIKASLRTVGHNELHSSGNRRIAALKPSAHRNPELRSVSHRNDGLRAFRTRNPDNRELGLSHCPPEGQTRTERPLRQAVLHLNSHPHCPIPAALNVYVPHELGPAAVCGKGAAAVLREIRHILRALAVRACESHLPYRSTIPDNRLYIRVIEDR